MFNIRRVVTKTIDDSAIRADCAILVIPADYEPGQEFIREFGASQLVIVINKM
jgi:translation elongation factor EF-1alpha